MKILEKLFATPQSEIERAVELISKQTVCKTFEFDPSDHKMINVEESNNFLIGRIRTSFWARGLVFDHYGVKFSSDGHNAVISRNGSIDFYFTNKEEVDALREAIVNKFKRGNNERLTVSV
jgi:hypothetical protein